jgi:hypothetical protein
MADLVDLAIPANAQAAAEALGLKVERSVTSGARVRQIPREERDRDRMSSRLRHFRPYSGERASGRTPIGARRCAGRVAMSDE